jgi:hypothetical protein
LLHLGRCEIRGARIHPPTGVSGLVAFEAMTHCAFGAEESVSFFDARLQIRWCWGNTVAAASTNQDGVSVDFLSRVQNRNQFKAAQVKPSLHNIAMRYIVKAFRSFLLGPSLAPVRPDCLPSSRRLR